MSRKETKKNLRRRLKSLQRQAIQHDLQNFIENFNRVCNIDNDSDKSSRRGLILFVVILFMSFVVSGNVLNSFLTTRCLLPNNFLIWEATRPLADCGYCKNVNKPIILRNINRTSFQEHAYSPGPVIVKNAIGHWKASKEFSFNMFKHLYEETAESYESLEDGCQFLNFKTNLFSLKEVFNMPAERARNDQGNEPWYVGWGNCHPDILSKVRRYYDTPNFLPLDAELPATENIFFGYEMGAVMHLDYISRLMWQGQVQGNKVWLVAPVPECDLQCQKFDFYVEAGDVVIMDTRIWYHSTKIPKGVFSLTVQSEYG